MPSQFAMHSQVSMVEVETGLSLYTRTHIAGSAGTNLEILKPLKNHDRDHYKTETTSKRLHH